MPLNLEYLRMFDLCFDNNMCSVVLQDKLRMRGNKMSRVYPLQGYTRPDSIVTAAGSLRKFCVKYFRHLPDFAP